MSYVSKTVSYMKRNGIRRTVCAVMERMNCFGADPDQIRANAYGKPAELFGDELGYKKENRTGSLCFSIVVPAYETKEAYLKEMIDSVVGQSYQNWQLVIADASATDRVKNVVETYEDERICYLPLGENRGISDNTNEALKAAKGDFIGLLDHDDVLCPDALCEIERFLAGGDYRMIYTDEDKMNEDGSIWFEPNFKPDFNLDFLLSNNYICHFTIIRRDLMEKLTFRREYDGAQDYDLFLQAVYEIEQERLAENGKVSTEKKEFLYPQEYMRGKIGHIPKILYHWRAHMASTADNPESKRYAYDAGMRALENFADKNGWKVEVEHTSHLGFYEIRYKPDIFEVRKDVAAVCGKVVRKGRVLKGPVMDGRMLFEGMNASYSGYMHRAAVKLDVEDADEECICRRKDVNRKESDKSLYSNDKTVGRMVYLPDYVVRK